MTLSKCIYDIGAFYVQLHFKNVDDVKMIQLLIQLVRDWEITKKSINLYPELNMGISDVISKVNIFVLSRVYRAEYVCFLEDIFYIREKYTKSIQLKYCVMYVGDSSKKYNNFIYFRFGIELAVPFKPWSVYQFPSVFYDYSFDDFRF